MEDIIVEKESKSCNTVSCQCHKIPAFLHELSQSVLIIHAYVNGCQARLKESTLDNKKLVEAFSVINKQTEIIVENIRHLNISVLLAVGE